jgi:hypothetical protein
MEHLLAASQQLDRSCRISSPSALRLIAIAPVVGALTIVAGMLWSDAALAQSVREDFYVTDGGVEATALSGTTLYIGGNFGSVGPASGSGVPIDAATGAPVAGFPKVAGTVNAVVPDGTGGYFIGGFFSGVGGLARSNLAHVLADNTVSPWNPGANNSVSALALTGGRLYAAGFFTTIAGQPRLGATAESALARKTVISD